eukprot:5344753-Ditylum_brightwellii.AAC.1
MGRKIFCHKAILHTVVPHPSNTTKRQSPSSCLADLRCGMSPSSWSIHQGLWMLTTLSRPLRRRRFAKKAKIQVRIALLRRRNSGRHLTSCVPSPTQKG